jgi:hypothetical protein
MLSKVVLAFVFNDALTAELLLQLDVYGYECVSTFVSVCVYVCLCVSGEVVALCVLVFWSSIVEDCAYFPSAGLQLLYGK